MINKTFFFFGNHRFADRAKVGSILFGSSTYLRQLMGFRIR